MSGRWGWFSGASSWLLRISSFSCGIDGRGFSAETLWSSLRPSSCWSERVKAVLNLMFLGHQRIRRIDMFVEAAEKGQSLQNVGVNFQSISWSTEHTYFAKTGVGSSCLGSFCISVASFCTAIGWLGIACWKKEKWIGGWGDLWVGKFGRGLGFRFGSTDSCRSWAYWIEGGKLLLWRISSEERMKDWKEKRKQERSKDVIYFSYPTDRCPEGMT